MNWIINIIKKYPIISAIIILILAYVLYKIISGAVRKAKARSNYNAAVNQSQDALNQLAVKGVKPSYAQSQYSTWADAIEQGFTGCGTGWDSVLKPTLDKLQNEADIFALIQAYKVRTIDECGWGTFEGDLGATIGYKFSGYHFCQCIPLWSCNCDSCGCVDAINKILKSKGIVFQF